MSSTAPSTPRSRASSRRRGPELAAGSLGRPRWDLPGAAVALKRSPSPPSTIQTSMTLPGPTSAEEEVYWENYKESLSKLGSLCSTLLVLGTTLSIYLRETLPIVIGLPDDIEVFGVPLNRSEAALAVLAIPLLQLAALRNLMGLARLYGSTGCPQEACKALLLGRHHVFSPFSRPPGRLGGLFSLLGLAAFLISTFVFPIVFVGAAISEPGVGIVLIAIVYGPIWASTLRQIHLIDVKLSGPRYARLRSASAVAILAVTSLILFDL